MQHYLLNDYVLIAKDLKKQGLLDVNDEKFMNELYDKLADMFVSIFGEASRTQITFIIKKQFESELL